MRSNHVVQKRFGGKDLKSGIIQLLYVLIAEAVRSKYFKGFSAGVHHNYVADCKLILRPNKFSTFSVTMGLFRCCHWSFYCARKCHKCSEEYRLGYWLKDPEFDSRQKQINFLFPDTSRQTVGPTRSPVQWVTKVLSRG